MAELLLIVVTVMTVKTIYRNLKILAFLLVTIQLNFAPVKSQAETDGSSQALSVQQVFYGAFDDYKLFVHPLFLEVLYNQLGQLKATEIDSRRARALQAEQIVDFTIKTFGSGALMAGVPNSQFEYHGASPQSVIEVAQFLKSIQSDSDSHLALVNTLFFMITDIHAVIQDNALQRKLMKKKWQSNIAARIMSLKPGLEGRISNPATVFPITELGNTQAIEMPVIPELEAPTTPQALPAPTEDQTAERTERSSPLGLVTKLLQGLTSRGPSRGNSQSLPELPAPDTSMESSYELSEIVDSLTALLSQDEVSDVAKLSILEAEFSNVTASESYKIQSLSLFEERQNLAETVKKKIPIVAGEIKGTKDLHEALEIINSFRGDFQGLIDKMGEQLAALDSLKKNMEEKAQKLESFAQFLDGLKPTDHSVSASVESLKYAVDLFLPTMGRWADIVQSRIDINQEIVTRLSEVSAFFSLREAQIHSSLSSGRDAQSKTVPRDESLMEALESTQERLVDENESAETEINIAQSEVVKVFLGTGSTGDISSHKALKIIVDANIRSEAVYSRLDSLLSKHINTDSMIYFRAFLDLFPDRFEDIYRYFDALKPIQSDERTQSFYTEANQDRKLKRQAYFKELLKRVKGNRLYLSLIDEARYRRPGNQRFEKFDRSRGLYLSELLIEALKATSNFTCQDNFLTSRNQDQ